MEYVWVLGLLIGLGIGGCGIPLTAYFSRQSIKESADNRMQSLESLGENLERSRELLHDKCIRTEDSLQLIDSGKYQQFHAFRLEAESLEQKLVGLIAFLQSDANDSSDILPKEVRLIRATYMRMQRYENEVIVAFCPTNPDPHYFNEWDTLGEEILYEMPRNAGIILLQKFKSDLYSLLAVNESCPF